jgi:lipopolysaccharide transport system permease protein
MHTQETLIEAGHAERHYWRDVWQYRELLYFLAWRDVLVRYKQTVFGVGWALLRPLLTMLVFVLVFGKLAKLPSEGVPYPLLVCAALLPWQLFSTALSEASSSLLGNANLVSKIYFPRVIVPVSSMVVCLVDFLVSLLILAGLMLYYGVLPTWRVLTLPLFTGLALLAAAGSGIGLAALNVRFRDFRFVVPFLVQFGMYVSPVGFSSKIVPEAYRPLYALNPMVGIIEGFRWALLGQESDLNPWTFLTSLAIIGVCLIVGVWYFRSTEQTIVDRI